MFDTGAALHVCPWWYGRQFPTYMSPGQQVTGADGRFIQVHGIRTIYLDFKLESGEYWVLGFTFTVCDVKEPILSFSKLLDEGCDCTLKPGDLHLGNADKRVPLHHEDRHFYTYPESFHHPEEHAVVSEVFSPKPLTIAPSYDGAVMRRVSGGNTDYWEIFNDRGILRRVHKRPRRHLFTPEAVSYTHLTLPTKRIV